MKGKVFEIKRFAVHDGDGIRTTVFLKGCPLACLWCHNPEGISFKSELAYYSHKCVGCGECVSVCKSGAHTVDERTGHLFDRSKCTGCGRCAEVCLGSALTFYGKDMEIDELMPILLEDRLFYESSGGGVTLSGGECLMQWEFSLELLKRLKSEGISTAVDTCGFVDKSVLDKVMPYTDVFLYDIKAIDEQTHIKCTGKSNVRILENIRYLSDKGAKVEVRIPFVPGYNGQEIEKMADLLTEIKTLVGVRVLPYHSYAGSKYSALDIESTLPERIPSAEELDEAKKILLSRTITVKE